MREPTKHYYISVEKTNKDNGMTLAEYNKLTEEEQADLAEQGITASSFAFSEYELQDTYLLNKDNSLTRIGKENLDNLLAVKGIHKATQMCKNVYVEMCEKLNVEKHEKLEIAVMEV